MSFHAVKLQNNAVVKTLINSILSSQYIYKYISIHVYCLNVILILGVVSSCAQINTSEYELPYLRGLINEN